MMEIIGVFLVMEVGVVLILFVDVQIVVGRVEFLMTLLVYYYVIGSLFFSYFV